MELSIKMNTADALAVERAKAISEAYADAHAEAMAVLL